MNFSQDSQQNVVGLTVRHHVRWLAPDLKNIRKTFWHKLLCWSQRMHSSNSSGGSTPFCFELIGSAADNRRSLDVIS